MRVFKDVVSNIRDLDVLRGIYSELELLELSLIDNIDKVYKESDYVDRLVDGLGEVKVGLSIIIGTYNTYESLDKDLELDVELLRQSFDMRRGAFRESYELGEVDILYSGVDKYLVSLGYEVSEVAYIKNIEDKIYDYLEDLQLSLADSLYLRDMLGGDFESLSIDMYTYLRMVRGLRVVRAGDEHGGILYADPEVYDCFGEPVDLDGLVTLSEYRVLMPQGEVGYKVRFGGYKGRYLDGYVYWDGEDIRAVVSEGNKIYTEHVSDYIDRVSGYEGCRVSPSIKELNSRIKDYRGIELSTSLKVSSTSRVLYLLGFQLSGLDRTYIGGKSLKELGAPDELMVAEAVKNMESSIE